MLDYTDISDRLRKVLDDLEKITGLVETAAMEGNTPPDFLTR